MRSARLTIFLLVLLILNIIPFIIILPAFIAVIKVLSATPGMLSSVLTMIVIIPVAIYAFSIYLIIMMFQRRAWARNVYIALAIVGWLMSLNEPEPLDLATMAVSIIVHIFVFYYCWHEFY